MKFPFRSLTVLWILLGLIALSPLAAPAEAASWIPVSPMASGRAWSTGTLLPDGRVLVAGGYLDSAGSTVFSSAEIFNPATGNWSSTGSMAFPRYEHTATLMPNGKVLVTGGYGGPGVGVQISAEIYNPGTGIWSTNPASMGSPRYGHTATLLKNGNVLIVGGSPDASSHLASAEIFDPQTGTWTLPGL